MNEGLESKEIFTATGKKYFIAVKISWVWSEMQIILIWNGV